jgi:hypothetical protein
MRRTAPTGRTPVDALALDVAALLYLSPAEAARLARIGSLYREGAAAPATLRALRTDVRRWSAWCRAERRPTLPARPADLAAFVLAAGSGRTPARRPARRRLRRRRRLPGRRPRSAAVSRRSPACTACSASPDPTKDEEVRAALRAVTRTRAAAGAGGQRQAAGITAPVLAALLDALGDTLIDRRDRALLLVGRDLLARRSELAALGRSTARRRRSAAPRCASRAPRPTRRGRAPPCTSGRRPGPRCRRGGRRPRRRGPT